MVFFTKKGVGYTYFVETSFDLKNTTNPKSFVVENLNALNTSNKN